jgi:dolichol-phosphate mannosyltransferase
MGVVVPLANEERTVKEFLRRVLLQLGQNDSVFCILDNVSTDSTRARVEECAAADDRVVLVWAPEDRSVVDAYFRGYREALDAGCEWILEMDGGLSHAPEEIPRFIEAMRGGVDFAAGCRFGAGGSYHGSLLRRLISVGGTLLTNLLTGTRMSDMTSGFECFSRRALQHVLARGTGSRAHFFQTEIRFMLRRFAWVEVPISYRNPSARLGRSSILEALRNLWALRREASNERANDRSMLARRPADCARQMGDDPL